MNNADTATQLADFLRRAEAGITLDEIYVLIGMCLARLRPPPPLRYAVPQGDGLRAHAEVLRNLMADGDTDGFLAYLNSLRAEYVEGEYELVTRDGYQPTATAYRRAEAGHWVDEPAS